MSCGCRPLPEEAIAAGCTLEPSAMPARADAFERLFARALLRREASPGQLVWTLRWSDEIEAEARALAAAESLCCSFFTFELSRQDQHLRWSVAVPPGREDTLALLDRLVGSTPANT
jgi:hypothetical protein